MSKKFIIHGTMKQQREASGFGGEHRQENQQKKEKKGVKRGKWDCIK